MKTSQARSAVNVTPFQRQVYEVVSRIPAGEVRSYQWVAAQLGNPRMARAVGQALKRNPYAPQVPCHRVVRADGSLGGYAFGVARKRRRLAQERGPRVAARPPSNGPHAP
jgi:O-6-methylguanine DNA methyltransferase